MLEISRDEDVIESITVQGIPLQSGDGELWYLPKGLVGELRVDQLPEDVAFQVCRTAEEGTITIDTIPFRLRRAGADRVTVHFEDSGTRKYWDGAVGFKPYMETKRGIVEERERELHDLRLESYEDDGAWIHLSYSAGIKAERITTVIEAAEQIIHEIEGAAELRLERPVWPVDAAQDEKEFTLRTVVPLLRELGFRNVRYSHGTREYGRDVLFARLTEFGELEHWAAQVKFGDVSGGAGGQIDELLSQADDAFRMPFYDVYTKQRQCISKLVIVISGAFTQNAIEKICEKLEKGAVRNNVIFIDGAKIKALAVRLRGAA